MDRNRIICAVCQGVVGEEFGTTGCGHTFCWMCILTASQKVRRVRCPVCREFYHWIIYTDEEGRRKIYHIVTNEDDRLTNYALTVMQAGGREPLKAIQKKYESDMWSVRLPNERGRSLELQPHQYGSHQEAARIAPWLLRELVALYLEPKGVDLCHYVLYKIREFPVRSPEFRMALLKVMQRRHVRRFIHHLCVFLMSGRTMEGFDRVVRYVKQRELPIEVIDIVTSSDSD